VQSTHDPEVLRALHVALIDVVDEMNRPRRDDRLLQEAAIPLDRALFPLLVRIDRFGPIGVVDLADRVGRDHTTVSRQVAKLEALNLVERSPSATDRRVRMSVITADGGAMIAALNAARERIANRVLSGWTDAELDTLRQLLRRFADDIMA
jgi:DNA-binding MarR family transcriptional regulator